MLKIKLSRTGKRHQPSYRIVVAERRSKRDGKYVALLGHFNPQTSPSTIVLDTKLYDQWLQKGAKPTDTVRSIRKNADKAPVKISPKTSGIGPKPSKLQAKKAKAAAEAKAAKATKDTVETTSDTAPTTNKTPAEQPKPETATPPSA